MSFDRADALRRLADEEFDVLVVGGGITGVGVALDAAARGLRTALVERDDLASGTSSKSSKLVHGGIRYLQQREVGLVYEALAERQILRETAPHLVRVLPFLLPVFTRDGMLPRRLARLLGATMWAYDLTGGLRIGKLHKRVSKEEALGYMPTLYADRVAASYIYYDAQTDDARLTLAVARTAADYGAAVANYTRLVDLEKGADGRVRTARVVADGNTIEVRARLIVNATGVWSDDIRALDEGTHPSSIRPAKGVHITVPWSLVQNKIAAVIPVPKDKRSVFVVPWGGEGGDYQFTYIGTTDTDYDGSIDDPQITPDDVSYLLRAINGAVTTTITESDILGTWAGLRPLVRAATSERTADLSRRHSVRASDSGVITVTGGKLTTYRRMAADTVDVAVEHLGIEGRRPSRTKKVRLHGATGWDAPELPTDLATRYGGDARAVLALSAGDSSLAEPIVPGLAYTRAEVVYATRAEMARTVDDVLSRRTRARLLARDASAAAAPDVAALMAAELGWDDAERDRQVEHYRALVETERVTGGLPRPRSKPSPSPPRSPVPRNPHSLTSPITMETNRGAPTPPIAFAGDAAAVSGRLDAARVEVGDQLREQLADTGADVSTSASEISEASRDWWPLAMIWALDNQVTARASVIVRPHSATEVSTVLRLCNEARVPVTAAAGRSGVCGASVPVFGGVLLDLTALSGIVDVDRTSMLVDVKPGTFGDVFEDELRAEHNVTCGHWPQSMALSTVGGWLACRGAGQLSTRYGKIEDIVAGIDVVLADGSLVTTGGAPRAAVGPDLTQVFVGSEGTLGIIVGARLRLHPVPPAEIRAAFAFTSFTDGLDAMRHIVRRGATPAVLRLYDAIEADRSYQTGDAHVLLAMDEGDAHIVDATRRIIDEECATAEIIDVGLVERWMQHRNDVSALEALISRGYVVDTMEVSASWRALPAVYEQATAAIQAVEHTMVASAHQSHSYPDGACLYFTFAGKPPDRDREAYYRAAWDAGQRAVLAAGGALSHHHGIGLNRSRFVAEALGSGFGVLQTVKDALDPNGILNPGKLGLASPFGAVHWP